MRNNSFLHMCIFNVSDALREGLCRFSGPSRTALIYAAEPDDPVRIYDPQDLLVGHEPKLKELLLDLTQWRNGAPDTRELTFMQPMEVDDYQLSGLICFGGRTKSLFMQLWFTEHHPDACSTGPTQRWLEYAASLLSQNLSTGNILSIGSSGYVLQECATHAVRDHIVDQRNIRLGWDTDLRVFPILYAILSISKTLEEGEWPRGELAFVEGDIIPRMSFMALFPHHERPSLENHKHVRKLLLSVENSSNRLISDGRCIIGISSGGLPESTIRSRFSGGHGFLLLDDDPVCSFSDGNFYSTTRQANLVQIEEILIEYNLDPESRHELFQAVTQIVQSAGDRKHGCTLVLDLNDPPLDISGQKLETPLNLWKPPILEVAKALAKVDGALQIGADLKLHRFACLLDGSSVPGESRARGARFNSALRFTAQHENIVVVVASKDRPVSVIQGGIELTAQCAWLPIGAKRPNPPTLKDWFESL